MSTMLLTTDQECDSALDNLNAENTQLERRLRNQGEALESRSLTTTELTKGITAVQALDSAINTVTTHKATVSSTLS